MKVRFEFETGNWEKAATQLHQERPEHYPSIEDAKEHLKNGTFEHFKDIPVAKMYDAEPWFYASLLAIPATFAFNDGQEKYALVTIRFWLSLKGGDRNATTLVGEVGENTPADEGLYARMATITRRAA